MDKHYHNIKLHTHELEEETEEQKKRRKVMKAVFSVILAIMVLSFIIPYDVLNSLISSSELNGNSIETQSAKVLFKPETLTKLQDYYKANQLTEFKLCLTGFIKDGAYYVTDFYEPKILFKTPVSIHSEICNESTIIDLHTHPFKNCLFSEQDIMSFKNIMNKEVLGAVMCDTSRFNFYKN